MPRKTPDERFDRSYAVEPTLGCWLWTSYTSEKDYAKFSVDGKDVRAHRWAYERFRGAIPPDRELDHRCRIRFCVNPDHLEIVTHAENMRRGADARRVQLVAWERATVFVEEHVSRARLAQRANVLKNARSVDDRFFESYREEPMTGCWLWVEELGKRGYGRFFDGKKRPMAHRYAFERAGHLVPVGHVLYHKCNEGSCVNPTHLYAARRTSWMKPRKVRKACKHGHSLVEGVSVYYRSWKTGPYSGVTRCCLTCRHEQETRKSRRRGSRRAIIRGDAERP